MMVGGKFWRVSGGGGGIIFVGGTNICTVQTVVLSFIYCFRVYSLDSSGYFCPVMKCYLLHLILMG
jgi:hypothetical protein